MSPFRYILRKGGVSHPVGYSLLLAACGMIVCMLAAVSVSVSASNRAIRQNQAQEARQQAAGKVAACAVIVAQDDAFNDPTAPPATQAGRNAAEAWHNLRKAFQCDKQ